MLVIDERFRAIKWVYLYDLVKVAKICLVPDMVILKKFKVSKVEKKNDTQCLITHLRVYFSKMAEVLHYKKHATRNEVVNIITNDSESNKKWAVLKVSLSKLFDILEKVNNLK